MKYLLSLLLLLLPACAGLDVRQEIDLVTGDLQDIATAYPHLQEEVAAVTLAIEVAYAAYSSNDPAVSGREAIESAIELTNDLLTHLDPEEDEIALLSLLAARASLRRILTRIE